MTISLQKASGRNAAPSANRPKTRSRLHHHLKMLVIGSCPSQVLLAPFRPDLIASGKLRHDAALVERVDAVGEGAHQRQVLLDNHQRGGPAELAKDVLELVDDAGRETLGRLVDQEELW